MRAASMCVCIQMLGKAMEADEVTERWCRGRKKGDLGQNLGKYPQLRGMI